MGWKNKTFRTSEELVAWASENNINFNRDESNVIQGILGEWHLFYMEE